MKTSQMCSPKKICLSPASYKELFCSPFETYVKIKTILNSWPARCCNKGKKKRNVQGSIMFLYYLYTRLFLAKPRAFGVYKRIYITRNNHFCLLHSSYSPIFCKTILQNSSLHSLVTTTLRTFNTINGHFFPV